MCKVWDVIYWWEKENGKKERGKNERKKMRYYGKKREKMGKYVRDRERVLDIWLFFF